MYVENKKISSRQMFRLYVFDLMGIATLLLPPYVSRLCGVDGVFAILAGTGLGFLYLFYLGWVMKQMKSDLPAFLKNRTNLFIQSIFFLCVMVHSILTAGFCAHIFGDLMQYTLVQESAMHILLFVIIFVAAYAVSGGIESRARIYEVLFWVVLIPYIAMMLATVKDFKINYWHGFLETDGGDFVKGVYLVFLFLTPLFFSLFLIGEKEKNYGRNAVKTVSLSVGVSALILFGSYILLLGNFGTQALSSMRYPVVTIMSTVQFKGNFLKRMDAFMLAVWFFTLYALLNLHLHYAVNMFGELWQNCRKRSNSTGNKFLGVAVPAVGVYIVAYAMYQFSELRALFLQYYSYVAVPFMIAVPGVLLLLGRKKNEK